MKVNGVNVLAAKIEGADAQSLRDAADQYKSRLGDAVVVLGAQVADDRVSLVVVGLAGSVRQCQRRHLDRGGGQDRRRARRRAARTSPRRAATTRPSSKRPCRPFRQLVADNSGELEPGGQSEATVGVFALAVPGLARPGRAGARRSSETRRCAGQPGRRAALAVLPGTRTPSTKSRSLPTNPGSSRPTRRDRIGRIWAPVEINGQGPFRLVLATGASHSALTPRLARTLGLTDGCRAPGDAARGDRADARADGPGPTRSRSASC